MNSINPADEAFRGILVSSAHRFAETVSKTLHGLLAIESKAGSAEANDKGISTQGNTLISVLFTGTVYGEFILALDEEVGARLLGRSLANGSDEEKNALRRELSDTMSELLNIVVGECIVHLGSVFKQLTITSPRVHFGKIIYPKVRSGHATVSSSIGDLDCILYIDRMKLDIADSYKNALKSLLTAHKKLQSAMHQLQDQQLQLLRTEKMAALGTMAGGIAHEINTPLTTIVLVEEELQNLLAQDPINRELAKQMLRVIEKTTQRIAHITQTLRVYVSEGASEATEKRPLLSIIDEATTSCGAAVTRDEVDLQVDCADNLTVECRPQLIIQVMQNIIENACNAVTGRPDRWVRIAARQVDSFIEVRITDSGPGIPKEIRERVFDPFFTTKEVGSGAGLGLSLAKGVVALHKGSIYLDHKSPHTQFVIRLPQEVPSTQPQEDGLATRVK